MADESKSGQPDLSQIDSVVGKVEECIVTYLESGKHFGLRLSAAQMEAVLDAVLTRVAGKELQPFTTDEAGYFMAGLAEEIGQMQASIYEKVTLPDGSEPYVPLSDELWKACLERLRGRVAGLG